MGEKIDLNKSFDSDKDDNIQQLQQKLTETEAELAEVTELKNAEIEVLRKQVNRAEHVRTKQEQSPQKEGEDEMRGHGKGRRDGERT